MIRKFLAACILIALTACGSFPVNPVLNKYDESVGYRFKQLDMGDKNTDSLFVIVVLSGGGTRAAALSYGVLDTLERTEIEWMGEHKSLLDEVDIISSVSGGSLTAAYYALNRKEIFSGYFESNVLKRDIEKDLIRQLFVPSNWFRLAGSSYGRSDLAADFYNRHIFNGATYASIPAQRPFVILNATDMTLGAQFAFIQDQFDLICSNLSELPVARAFASSSAFPGLLTPLTYQNFAGRCQFQDYPWVELALNDRRIAIERTIRAENRISYYKAAADRRDYIHLIDGGVSDNIGLRGPYFAITTTDPTYSILQKINNSLVKKIVVIVANAAVYPDTAIDKKSKVPGLFETAVKAATVPLDNYSVDTIERLKAFIQDLNGGTADWINCNNILESTCSQSLPIPKPKAVDFYLVEVAFEYIQDPARRHIFENIPTNFGLPSKTVDMLIDVGCELVIKDPKFDLLLSGDSGLTGLKVSGLLPKCD